MTRPASGDGARAGMERIFGPVPSRRLGLSLGVDVIPYKTCTFDCVYCECGATTRMRREGTVLEETILALLSRRPCTAADMYAAFGADPPAIDSVLKKLVRDGKISTERRGDSLYYLHGHSRG